MKGLFLISLFALLGNEVGAFSPARIPTLTPHHNAKRSSSPRTLHPVPCVSSAMNTKDLYSGLKMLPTSSDILSQLSNVDYDTAEALAGPFFGLSLLPYLAFLYLLNVKENNTPKGVIAGLTALLAFVFLTIPAAVAAKVWYGASLADCDWLHASAESLLTGTNLVTVVAFRQAISAFEKADSDSSDGGKIELPLSVTSYAPMMWLMAGWTLLAGATAFIPAILGNPAVHEPFLGGVLDLPLPLAAFLEAHREPANALSVGCWIIHISSLIEFLAIMEYCWQWGNLTGNPKWKGLVWGLLPLHTSGITACTYHFFYNQLPILVPLQAFLTCVGNGTAAYAAWRIARSNAWEPSLELPGLTVRDPATLASRKSPATDDLRSKDAVLAFEFRPRNTWQSMRDGLLATSNNYTFLLKLFGGCAVASYAIKYGETWVSIPSDTDLFAALSFIGIASGLNAFKWYQRSQDPSFDGWF